MNRTALVLLFLLVATNLTWLATRDDAPSAPEAPSAAPDPGTPRETARERDLAAQVARLEERLARYELPAAAEEAPAENSSPETIAARAADAEREAAEQAGREETKAKAARLHKQWLADVRQIEDPALRARALEEVRLALASDDDAHRLAALWVLGQSWGLEYDQATYRPLVTPCLDSDDPEIRAAAVWAVLATKCGRETLPLLLPLIEDEDPTVRTRVPAAILRLTDNRLDEETTPAFLKLLSDSDPRIVRTTADALGHIRELPADVESRLFVLAKGEDRSLANSILFALGRRRDKSEAVVDLLLPHLDANGWNDRQIAYRGLSSGIPDGAKKRVADAVVRALPKLPDYNNVMMCFRILNDCADASHLTAVERFLENPMLNEMVKKNAERWMETLRKRVAR